MKKEVEDNNVPTQIDLFKTSEEIRSEVEELLDLQDEDEAVSVNVSVDDYGMVTLSGSVPDKYALAAAARIAGEVPGVTRVRNELEIAR